MFDVREKPKIVERAFIVGIYDGRQGEAGAQSLLEELAELVTTLGIGIVEQQLAKVREPHPRYLVGSGKAEQIVEAAKAAGADCLVLDAELSPAQQRNWEALSQLCVIDRQEVILDIFHERAQTREAVLQVDLARAEHALPRLKNAWTHLSRQRGGGGVTQRGEGEAQIELDARMVRQRIARLKEELGTVVRHRKVQRHQRGRVPLPTAALVGYTNAGKSSLLNALTGADVLAEDKLFATLDPTTRALVLPHGQKLLLTDTVGFVRRLPHGLVEAFKATLEEAVAADFLLHVIDATTPEMEAHRRTTLEVLRELGAEEKRILTVYNKVDLLPGGAPAAGEMAVDADAAAGPHAPSDGGVNGYAQVLPVERAHDALYVSAATGQGIAGLLARMEALLQARSQALELFIPHDRYDVIHKLHQAGAVREERPGEAGVAVSGFVPDRLLGEVRPFVV